MQIKALFGTFTYHTNLDAKSKMKMSFQVFAKFCLHVWFLIWLEFVGMAFVTGCKSCRNSRVERQKRLLAVQGQILAKLGLTKPPNDETILNVTRDVMQTYRSAVQEKDKLFLQSKMCRSQVEADEEYFAKRVERLVVEKESARTVITSKYATKMICLFSDVLRECKS